jgi:hypothetical protein
MFTMPIQETRAQRGFVLRAGSGDPRPARARSRVAYNKQLRNIKTRKRGLEPTIKLTAIAAVVFAVVLSQSPESDALAFGYVKPPLDSSIEDLRITRLSCSTVTPGSVELEALVRPKSPFIP